MLPIDSANIATEEISLSFVSHLLVQRLFPSQFLRKTHLHLSDIAGWNNTGTSRIRTIPGQIPHIPGLHTSKLFLCHMLTGPLSIACGALQVGANIRRSVASIVLELAPNIALLLRPSAKEVSRVRSDARQGGSRRQPPVLPQETLPPSAR